MAVRIADTLKQQNNLTTFPVAYGEDIWLDKNKGVGTENYSNLQTMFNNNELGGGGSIFYGTMDEWNALSADEKKQYDYMADDDETSSSVYPSAPTTPELVVDESNKSSNIDKSYTVVKKAFHIVKVHCYSEQESHSAQVYLNGVMLGNESSYNATSGVGYTVTIPCNVGDIIRTIVACGGSGTYDKRNAQIFCLN